MSEYWPQTTPISGKKCRVSAEKGPIPPLSFFVQRPQRGPRGCVKSHYCPHGQITYGPAPPSPHSGTMQDCALYSIQEARELLGGISRNTIYRLLRTGELASVVIGCRRCIPAAAIEALIQASTIRVSRSRAGVREPRPHRQLVAPAIPARASARAAERGHFAILPPSSPSPSNQRRR